MAGFVSPQRRDSLDKHAEQIKSSTKIVVKVPSRVIRRGTGPGKERGGLAERRPNRGALIRSFKISKDFSAVEVVSVLIVSDTELQAENGHCHQQKGSEYEKDAT